MIRLLVGILGFLTTLFPDRIVEQYEAVAIQNSDACRIRSWITTGIRTEGVLVTIASLIGGRAYGSMMHITGAFGAIVLLFPDYYRRFAGTVLYENADTVEWNDQFASGVRLIGVLYVVLAAKSFITRRRSD